MLRHFHLFAAAPGREDEAERELRRWLADVSQAPQFRGGAVLREYAGEFGDVRGALALTYDVESRDAGGAFREATGHVPNPTAQDVPGEEPADQGGVLFGPGDALKFDRGGGLLARLMHGHFEILTAAPQSNGSESGTIDARAPART